MGHRTAIMELLWLCMQKLNVPCIIYVPEKSSDAGLKYEKLWSRNKVFGKDCMDSELKARELQIIRWCTYLSPYNDPEVVNGQGTIARKLSCNVTVSMR